MSTGVYFRTGEAKINMSLAHTGKHLSEETKKKMSMRMKGNKYSLGRRLSEETKTKIKLMKKEKNINPPFLGKKHSEESKQKMSLSHAGYKPSEETRKKTSERMKGNKYSLGKGHKLTKETRIKISLSHIGSNNPQWKGGISSISALVRASFKYHEWQKNIKIRDNFTCQKCGQVGGRLESHHHKKLFDILLEEARLDSPLLPTYEAAMIYEPLWDINNGITWCLGCHAPTRRQKLLV